ncbi:branched-chain amino acid ABC transporter permease [Chelatococcus reniformis]|uniref:Branched-chain amino acid ABC transporter permease n=1 Tax=Chelatococcus reniformis TaxID=1494448 RepID=A0A916XEP0_9HYPH|nr:branched-chain amino acid ABC transporter permease [Chelatococcus reniformis]GGC67962.1 branched-chain amino acid ABC transporter permease [Chelatococcus reniformis]
MDLSILLILVQDGVINGAIYALLALSLVLVFTVTRVIFIPQGEFVSFGALTLAFLERGQAPGTLWLLVGLGVAAAIFELMGARRQLTPRLVARILAVDMALPIAISALTLWLAPQKLGVVVQVLLALAIITPIGAYLYRVAYQPLAGASVLVLLIASIGVHLALTGLGLVFFGAEGSRTDGFSSAMFDMGQLMVSGQSLWIVGITLGLVGALAAFFELTLLGKALRATAVNRLGARLVGIAPALSGAIAFTLAAFLGALSGVLVSPITTIYYDTGFIVGLKGFVAAIIAGLASYPLAGAAAIVVGIIEALSSYWASAFKEVIVFLVIIPVLLWRSWRAPVIEEEE